MSVCISCGKQSASLSLSQTAKKVKTLASLPVVGGAVHPVQSGSLAVDKLHSGEVLDGPINHVDQTVNLFSLFGLQTRQVLDPFHVLAKWTRAWGTQTQQT